METLTIQQRAKKMMIDIDGNKDRSARKEMMSYDKESLRFLIKNGLVSVRENVVSRKGFGTNYEVVNNF